MPPLWRGIEVQRGEHNTPALPWDIKAGRIIQLRAVTTGFCKMVVSCKTLFTILKKFTIVLQWPEGEHIFMLSKRSA